MNNFPVKFIKTILQHPTLISCVVRKAVSCLKLRLLTTPRHLEVLCRNIPTDSIPTDNILGQYQYQIELTVFFLFSAKPRVWVHLVHEPRLCGPGAGRPLPHPRRQEDRPQARHAQIQVQEQQGTD